MKKINELKQHLHNKHYKLFVYIENRKASNLNYEIQRKILFSLKFQHIR